MLLLTPCNSLEAADVVISTCLPALEQTWFISSLFQPCRKNPAVLLPWDPQGLCLIVPLFQQHLEICLEFPTLAGLRARGLKSRIRGALQV